MIQFLTTPSQLVRLAVSIVCFLSGTAMAASWRYVTSPAESLRQIDVDSLKYVSPSNSDISYKIRVGGQEKIVLGNCRGRQRIMLSDRNDSANQTLQSVVPATIDAAELNMACGLIGSPSNNNQTAEVQPNSNQRKKSASSPERAPPRELRIVSTGSGFVVAKNMVVTNHHVVQGCSELRIRQGVNESLASLRSSTERTDLALIYTQNVFRSSAAVRQSAALGEEVMVAGYPLSGILGTDLIITGGQVNSLAGMQNDPTLLQISAPVQSGNSGGPLVDKSGDIVGVVVSKVDVEKLAKITGDMAQNINFAIKPEVLRLFLDANQVAYTVARASKNLENKEIAQKTKGFTVQVICLQ